MVEFSMGIREALWKRSRTRDSSKNECGLLDNFTLVSTVFLIYKKLNRVLQNQWQDFQIREANNILKSWHSFDWAILCVDDTLSLNAEA